MDHPTHIDTALALLSRITYHDTTKFSENTGIMPAITTQKGVAGCYVKELQHRSHKIHQTTSIFTIYTGDDDS